MRGGIEFRGEVGFGHGMGMESGFGFWSFGLGVFVFVGQEGRKISLVYTRSFLYSKLQCVRYPLHHLEDSPRFDRRIHGFKLFLARNHNPRVELGENQGD